MNRLDTRTIVLLALAILAIIPPLYAIWELATVPRPSYWYSPSLAPYVSPIRHVFNATGIVIALGVAITLLVKPVRLRERVPVVTLGIAVIALVIPAILGYHDIHVWNCASRC